MDQFSFTQGPASDNRLAAPEINPAREACLLQRKPVHHPHAALSLKLWQGVYLLQSEWRDVLMSMSQTTKKCIWRYYIGGGWNWGNHNAVCWWGSLHALFTAVMGHVGFTAGRISHALFSRKYLQKKSWLLVSLHLLWHVWKFGDYGKPQFLHKQAGYKDTWMSPSLVHSKQCSGCVSTSQQRSTRTESHICLPLTDTTVQPVWPQQDLYWNRTCDHFSSPHPIYCTKTMC